MATSDDDSSSNLEDTPMKLPPFTEIKADGHFRYRRRVPKKLVALLGRIFRSILGLCTKKDEIRLRSAC